MKKTILLLLMGLVICLNITSCKKKNYINFDDEKMNAFFTKYPKFEEYRAEIEELYDKNDYHYIWIDKKGVVEFSEILFNRVNQIRSEGVVAKVPYKDDIDKLFYENQDKKPTVNTELLISAMYFFYAKNVFEGLDPKASKQTGWYIARDKVSYVSYLDTLMKDPSLLKKNDEELIPQYFNLKKGLQKYRDIEKKGGWEKIQFDAGTKSLKPGDNSNIILQIRKRLFATGDLRRDSGSSVFDKELVNGLYAFQTRNNLLLDKVIDESIIKHLNVTVQERIKSIMVNMERCRWISTDFIQGGDYIAVNIPSYKVSYFKDGKLRLESNVVVGKALNKTVVFSGQMSYLVFSPYWNVPKSILEEEIKVELEKDPDYLAKHNMEWKDEAVRQLPGEENSLGLVKFMFPNSNNIYLHDSPAKSLYNKESRAFSHGCVRVQKAKELANAILEDDKNWTPEKITEAMNSGTEQQYALKKKIPVYIAYFTASADENGNVSFYEDVYDRDNRLASYLYKP